MLVRINNGNQHVNLSRDGYLRNENGGFYMNGRKYPTKLRLQVAEEYARLSNNFTTTPNYSNIARVCCVRVNYVKKVDHELCIHGYIRDL